MAEYAGFFESGREEGRSEEDVASALGSPAGLVRMLAGEKAGQGPAFPVSPPAAPSCRPPSQRRLPASVFPPRASFGRRVGAYLIDRLAVFLIVALLIAAAVWLSSPGTDTGTGGAASQIQAHLDDGSAVRAEAPMVIAFGPLLLLLSILAPQLGFPLILLFFLRSPINPETYKAEAALLTGVMLGSGCCSPSCTSRCWNASERPYPGKRLMGIRWRAPDGGRQGWTDLRAGAGGVSAGRHDRRDHHDRLDLHRLHRAGTQERSGLYRLQHRRYGQENPLKAT